MQRNYLLYLAGLAIIIGAFFIFKPQTSPANPPAATNSATPTVKTFDLVVQNKKLVAGPEKIEVTEGDQVIIRISSDTDEEFHLHGYGKSVTLKPNETSALTFNATLTGSFAFELESSKTDLGTVEVAPK